MADQTLTFNFVGKGSQLVSETKKIIDELAGVKRGQEEVSEAFRQSSDAVAAFASSAQAGTAEVSAAQAKLRATILQAQAERQISAKQAQDLLNQVEAEGLNKRIALAKERLKELKLLEEQINAPGPAPAKKVVDQTTKDRIAAEEELAKLQATSAQRAISANEAQSVSSQRLNGGVAELAAKYYLVLQALQAVMAVAKPAYDLLIGQNIELQQQLLATQSSLAATNKVFANGVEITDPTEAIKALEGPVNEAIARIRKGSLELVGVTSAQLVPIFQNIAGQSSAIGATLEDSDELTLKFAATLGTLNVPLDQQRQEVSSILQGTIDQNSIVAKTLNITNEQVNNWKSQGILVSELSKRLEPFVAGNALAAQTIGGISSNIQELLQNVTLAAGKPLTEEIAKDLADLYKYLKDNEAAIQEFVNKGSEKILLLLTTAKETGVELGKIYKPILEDLRPFIPLIEKIFDVAVVGLGKLSEAATRYYTSNPALQAFLLVARAAQGATKAIEGLTGGQQAQGKAQAKTTEETKKLTDETNKQRDAVTLVSKDTQQYTNQLKLQTEEYKRNTDALAAQTAIRQAILSQARAKGDLSEREFAARTFAAEQAEGRKRIDLARKRVADIDALKNKTSDSEQQKQFESQRIQALQEQAKAETDLAQKTISERKRLQSDANQDLETEQKKATDAIASFELEKQTAIQEALNAGILTQEQADARKLALTRARIQAEIIAEQDRTRALEQNTFDDPQEAEANQAKIRASRQKTAQLTLQALTLQRQSEQDLAKAIQKRIQDQADQERNQSEARKQQLEAQLKAQDLLNNSIDRQSKLLKAASDLASATSNLAAVGGQIEVDNLNRALEIRKKLNDANLDPEVRKVLQDQLKVLTGSPNTSEARIVAERVKRENELANLKRQSLALEQQTAQANLAIELQRNKLAAERLVIETKNAQLAAQQSLADAQANLDKLNADPNADPQAKRNAQAAVDRAAQNVQFADQVAGDAQKNLAQQGQLAEFAAATLAAQQKAAIAQFEAADYARVQAAQLALVEAKAQNIAALLKQASPQQFNATVDQYAQRNQRLLPATQPIFAPAAPVQNNLGPVRGQQQAGITLNQGDVVNLLGQILKSQNSVGSLLAANLQRPQSSTQNIYQVQPASSLRGTGF